MADAVLQSISCPPSPCDPKLLYPGIEVKNAGAAMRGYYTVQRNSSRSEPADSVSVTFSGQEYYSDLNPQATSPPIFSVITKYMVGSQWQEVTLFTGYPEKRNQSLVSGELTTTSEFLEKVQLLIQPKSKKIFIDVLNYTRGAIALAGTGFVTCRDLVDRILSLSGSGIGLRYLGFDYRINNYRNEDYPLNIIRDLVEFVGCFIRYNSIDNVIEIVEKNPPSTTVYDFLYKDDGDIIDLGDSDNLTEYYNAIIVEGIEPDMPPTTTTVTTATTPSYPIDDKLYLVDTIMGKERAPSAPYIDKPPVELIKKKFFNVYLGFDIDPSTIDIQGGSWNEDTKKYEGAEFLGYGGFTPASSVLLSSVTAPAISSSGSLPLSSGEGLVGIPWNYEKNEPTGTFALSDGIYTVVDLLGKVVKSTDGTEIGGAQVVLDFAEADNIWQYWKHNAYNVVVRFYLPAGGVSLSSDWSDVTAEYPGIDPPLGFPKSTLSASGASSAGVGGLGTFTFSDLPISAYVATASAIGYDDNDLEIEYDSDSLWDFLKSSGSDPSKDYMLVDTPYHVAIYAKKAPPIIFGTYPPYTPAAAAIVPPPETIRLEIRHNRGITFAGGKLIYAPKIQDIRIITEEIAQKVGESFLEDSLSKRTRKTLQLPHNPWLKAGDKICIQSYAKGWFSGSAKILIVDSISTAYNVGGQGEEGLYDTIEGVEQY
jgi:hypothetical protein